MIHDPDLLDRLDALPKESFDGAVFRGTRQSLDPLASSYSGGRWMRRDGAGVLYTSLAREARWRRFRSTGVSSPLARPSQSCCTRFVSRPIAR